MFGVCLFVSMSCHCCKKAMLGYLPHCADNGREPTSVAFMYKEESLHWFDGYSSSSTGNYCHFW